MMETFQYFLKNESLPSLLQTTALAVLTIQISFAVGIFIEVLKNKDKPNGVLDLHVILDHVWEFKTSLVAIIINLLCPLLVYTNIYSRLDILISWIASFSALVIVLLRLYNWVKGNGGGFRSNYLSSGKKGAEDTTESWKSLWIRESDDRFQDQHYFKIFSSKIDDSFKTNVTEDLNISNKLISDFYENIGKRDKIFLLIFDDFFPKILEWQHIIWTEQFEDSTKGETTLKGDSPEYIAYFNMHLLIDQIIHYITKEALIGKQATSFSFFKNLERHVKKYNSYFIKEEDRELIYVEYIPVYRILLENIPKSKESYDIWNHYFPKYWKVTEDNYRYNIEARIWFMFFADWASTRVWNKNEEGWDKELDELSKELFPTVDPSLWSRILTFVFSPWSGSRIENILKVKRNFGFIGRIMTGWVGQENIDEKFSSSIKVQDKETIKLAFFLFGNIFSEKEIEVWLKELESLKSIDTLYEKERETWIRILQQISTYRKVIIKNENI